MTPWPAMPAVDQIVLNRWEVEVKQLAGKIHDAGYWNPTEAMDLCHKLAGLASEHLARLEWKERRAIERGLEERETAIPPLGS